jgi:hypothetical protein
MHRASWQKFESRPQSLIGATSAINVGSWGFNVAETAFRYGGQLAESRLLRRGIGREARTYVNVRKSSTGAY